MTGRSLRALELCTGDTAGRAQWPENRESGQAGRNCRDPCLGALGQGAAEVTPSCRRRSRARNSAPPAASTGGRTSRLPPAPVRGCRGHRTVVRYTCNHREQRKVTRWHSVQTPQTVLLLHRFHSDDSRVTQEMSHLRYRVHAHVSCCMWTYLPSHLIDICIYLHRHPRVC